MTCTQLTYNAALNRPAYQSSPWEPVRRGVVIDFPASMGNDGSRRTTHYNGTHGLCAVSNESTNPWWAVDLGRPTTVHKVVFTNRGDGAGIHVRLYISLYLKYLLCFTRVMSFSLMQSSADFGFTPIIIIYVNCPPNRRGQGHVTSLLFGK